MLRNALALAVLYLVVANGFLFFLGTPQIALMLGALAAMMFERPARAAAWAAGVVAVVSAIAPPFVETGTVTTFDWVRISLLTGASAFAVAWLRALSQSDARERARADAGIVGVLVIVLLLNLWIPLLIAGTNPLAGYGPLPASTIRAVPLPGAYQNDDELYRRFFFLLHEGRGHYAAFREAWSGLQSFDGFPQAVFSYRLPTYYWIWRMLPNDAFLIEVVFLTFASCGVVAAALIGAQLSGPVAALLAAASVAAYAMGIAISVYMVYVDFPAVCVALVGCALYLRGRRTGHESFIVGGIAALLLAALMRELLVFLLPLAFLATCLGAARDRRRTRWIIAGAMLIFAVAYSMHAYAVSHWIPVRTAHLDYLQGNVRYALDAIETFGNVFHGTNAVLAGLCLTGILALGVHVARPLRRVRDAEVNGPESEAWLQPGVRELLVLLFLASVLPLAVMSFVGNPGVVPGRGYVNYWGMWFVPLALTAWPLALGRVEARDR